MAKETSCRNHRSKITTYDTICRHTISPYLMKNPVFHGRSKHIDIRYHFIRECVENGEIIVTHVCGKSQKAGILTKSLARVKHEETRDLIGVNEINN